MITVMVVELTPQGSKCHILWLCRIEYLSQEKATTRLLAAIFLLINNRVLGATLFIYTAVFTWNFNQEKKKRNQIQTRVLHNMQELIYITLII